MRWNWYVEAVSQPFLSNFPVSFGVLELNRPTLSSVWASMGDPLLSKTLIVGNQGAPLRVPVHQGHVLTLQASYLTEVRELFWPVLKACTNL